MELGSRDMITGEACARRRRRRRLADAASSWPVVLTVNHRGPNGQPSCGVPPAIVAPMVNHRAGWHQPPWQRWSTIGHSMVNHRVLDGQPSCGVPPTIAPSMVNHRAPDGQPSCPRWSGGFVAILTHLDDIVQVWQATRHSRWIAAAAHGRALDAAGDGGGRGAEADARVRRLPGQGRSPRHRSHRGAGRADHRPDGASTIRNAGRRGKNT